VILPVIYTVIDDTVVFCAGTGNKLTAATAKTVVVFQADPLRRRYQYGVERGHPPRPLCPLPPSPEPQ
jgi:hypothetical protein